MAADFGAPFPPAAPDAGLGADARRPNVDPRALWQGQPTEAFHMSAAALVAAAAHEHRRLRRAAAAQYAGIGVALAAALVLAVLVDVPLIRLGLTGVAAAFLFVLHAMRRAGRGRAALGAAPPAGALLAEPSLAHYRAELVRQRDRRTGARLWGRFAIAVPSGLVLMFGVARAEPSLTRFVWLELAAFAVAMPLAAAVERRRAQRFQARIDELDALARGDARDQAVRPPAAPH